MPEILYNLGQCHYELHQWRRAAYYYRRFLEARPHATVADQVRTRSANLDQMEAAAPQPPKPQVEPPPTLPPGPPEAVNPPENLLPPEPPGPTHALSLGLAGAAAVCAVIGVYGILRVVAYDNLASEWNPNNRKTFGEIPLSDYQQAQATYVNAQNWEWGTVALFRPLPPVPSDPD